jgi:hypothetical protein
MSRALSPVPVDVTDIAVPLSTRVSLEARRTIERVATEQKLTIREVVELAIEQRWGGDSTGELKRAVGE